MSAWKVIAGTVAVLALLIAMFVIAFQAAPAL